jgi:hypothetical protein
MIRPVVSPAVKSFGRFNEQGGSAHIELLIRIGGEESDGSKVERTVGWETVAGQGGSDAGVSGDGA